ncbi:MAG: AI-2E family transporter [Leptolyngbyaceae bacterium]|nr:AI-2E family transporter [Leptolyngbyaceae bacterium]
MNQLSNQRVSISLTTLFLIPIFLFALVVLWQLRSLIVLLLISVVLAAAIAPIVDWAERWRIPRWLSVILIYLGLIGGLTGVILLIGPTVFDQLQRLIFQVPEGLKRLIIAVKQWMLTQNDEQSDVINRLFSQILDVQSLVSWGIRSTQRVLAQSVSVTTDIVGGVLSLILALFISGYMISDSRKLIHSLTRLFPKPWDDRLMAQVTPISRRIGSYVRGRILVSAILSIATATSLRLLGLSDFALALGAIAGLTNLIPFIGPILGAIPALVVAISQGWWMVLWVFILFVIIQNVETYVLDPVLVGNSVGVHPLYQLLAVIGGTQLLGIIGAVIIPPWVAGAAVLLENLYLQPKMMAERQPALAQMEPISTPH